MPKNFDGVIEIILDSGNEQLGVRDSVTSTIQNIKDIWNNHHGNTDVDLCCIFDAENIINLLSLYGVHKIKGISS